MRRHRASEARTRALDQVLAVTMLLNADMEREFARLGLTGPRVRLLWSLSMSGPVTQRVLSEALGVTPRNVTGLVDALEATGFVTREPHPNDRRAAVITLTQHGAEVIAAMVESHRQLAAELFAGATEEDIERFSDMLARVTEHLVAATDRSAAPPRSDRP